MAEHHWFWQGKGHRKSTNFNRLFRANSSRQLSPTSGRISNKLVSETFWPDSIDKECEKASRILYSFCKHGMYQDEAREDSSLPIQKTKVWSRVPEEVVSNAKGIVVFTAMRPGLWVSGAGGSGLVLARTSNGSWSYPVAVEIHTAELGFLVGVDIYDCLLVLNTTEAVEAFAKSRCIIGGDLYAIPGPLGVGWFFGKDNRSKHAPIFSYLRSRGYYAAVQMDHAIVLDRSEENKRFYDSATVTARDILSGKLSVRPASCLGLFAMLRSSEGKPAVDDAIQPPGPPPSDFEVVEEGHTFGVPDKEDPDPYGVLALEKQGFVIKEAATKTSPTTESFDFNPSITSPIYEKYNRKSSENTSPRSSWRRSVMSNTDRRETGSVISIPTDHESEPPLSPGFANWRHNQQQDLSPYSRHGRQLSNGRSSVNELDFASKSVVHSKAPISMSGPETIYEDESADHTRSQDVSDIMDRMVDMLQGPDKLRSKAAANETRLPNSADLVARSYEQQTTSLRIDTAQPDSNSSLDERSPQETKDSSKLQNEPDHAVQGSDVLNGDEITNRDNDDEDGQGDDDEFSDLDEVDSPVEIHDAVIQGGPATIYQSAATVSMPKARIVNVSKPAAPVVPARNPGRLRPASDTPSVDDRSQVASSVDPESTQSSHQDEKASTQPSSPTSPPVDEPVTPVSPSKVDTHVDHVSEAEDEQITGTPALHTASEDISSTPRPEKDDKGNPAPLHTLASMRQTLNSSPSPVSPEDSKDYFSEKN